jgi:hypothetical protein
VYSLKFEMMVQVLQQFGPTGEFRAHIPPQSALREGGQAVLIVRNGTITSCFILNRNGQKIYHNVEASRLLSRLGVLDWQLAPSTSTATEAVQDVRPASAARPASTVASYPRHRPVPQLQMRTWTVLQRSVYVLADGTRGIEQIAALLSRPSHAIEQALRDLQAFNAIE